MAKSPDNNQRHPLDELDKRIQVSTKQVRGDSKVGHDALLFLNTRYESFPVAIQQETLISSNAKSVYNNLWIWAKTKQASSIPASLFPGYDWINRATGLERATIASSLTQLRLQRYLTLHQKVRKENGRFVGNDYILNDEPMSMSDTLSLDNEYVTFVQKSLKHRHQRVEHLAQMAFMSINHHIQRLDDPFRPASQIEKVEARQQANQIIQQRLFPEESRPGLPEPEHYYGLPIQDYRAMVDRVHKVNAVESNEIAQVHKVNSVMNTANSDKDNLVHKVNSVEAQIDQPVHKVNAAVNLEVNGCSSSFLYNTTTTETGFTEEPVELVYPEFDSANERAICQLHIARLNPEYRQPILDELAGRMTNKHLAKLENPIGYLKGWLIKQLEEGQIPLTSRSSQQAATRDPQRPALKPDRNSRQLLRDLQSEVQHLNRMIDFEASQGKTPQSLIQQRDEKVLALKALESEKNHAMRTN